MSRITKQVEPTSPSGVTTDNELDDTSNAIQSHYTVSSDDEQIDVNNKMINISNNIMNTYNSNGIQYNYRASKDIEIVHQDFYDDFDDQAHVYDTITRQQPQK